MFLFDKIYYGLSGQELHHYRDERNSYIVTSGRFRLKSHEIVKNHRGFISYLAQKQIQHDVNLNIKVIQCEVFHKVL